LFVLLLPFKALENKKKVQIMDIIYLSVGISFLIWLYIIYRYDKYEPEPFIILIITGIAGGLMSSIPAALLNTAALSMLGLDSFFFSDSGVAVDSFSLLKFSLFVGFNEEIWKAAAALFILKRLKHFNEPADALIYSMTIALGFAAFENIEYTLMGGINILVLRSFTAVPLHVGLAAIWGMGIAKGKYIMGGRYFSVMLPYVAAAALVHAIYNYLQFIVYSGFSLIIAVIFSLMVISYAVKRLNHFVEQSPFKK
jgi:RsiW-degrading membrane proteinase PrsW (M82 family)